MNNSECVCVCEGGGGMVCEQFKMCVCVWGGGDGYGVSTNQNVCVCEGGYGV